jgi:hypothetical protein
MSEQQRVVDTRLLSEAHASHLISQINRLQAQVDASEEEAARERARAHDHEREAAASHRNLTDFRAEIGAQIYAELGA